MSATTENPPIPPQLPVAPNLAVDEETHSSTTKPSPTVECTDVEKASVASIEDREPPLESEPGKKTDNEDDANRPKGLRFALLYGCILVGCFAQGYDNSCIATLAPVITDHFNALNNLGWYGIAYLLATSATMLVYGQLYSFFSMKKLYIGSFFIFTIGSVVTATAPSSVVFIVGRALSGLGSAGIFAGLTIIIANTTSLKHRATYTGVLGGVECSALAFGPLISGAIARYTTWRVAFYIIIPIGVAVMATVYLSVHDLRRPENADLGRKEKVKRLDLIGIVLNILMTLCLVLALQWAGTTYSWSNWRIILLLTLAGVLFLSWLYSQYRAGDKGMLPLKVLSQRTVALACVNQFCNVGGNCVIAYYLAIYFQAVRGATTFGSGIMYLPTAASMTVGALAGGPLTSRMGYPNINLIVGSVLMCIGSGLITTFTPTTPVSQWAAFQVLYGIGIGIAFQPSWVLVQTVLSDKLVPMGMVTLAFSQMFGGIVVLSIAQTVFFNKLGGNLAKVVPGFHSAEVARHGALNIVRAVPAEYRGVALVAYNKALVNVLYIPLVLCCITAVCGLGMEWKSVKTEKKKGEVEEGEAAS